MTPTHSKIALPLALLALDRVVAAGAPGTLALVRERDRTIRLASGYADPKAKRPMRATDRFRIGSVTKTCVATVVLQLIDQGRLSLTDTVEDRLPGLVPNDQAITVRQLLNTTSGLFDYPNDLGSSPRSCMDRLLADQFAGCRRDRGDRVRALVGVRTEHDH